MKALRWLFSYLFVAVLGLWLAFVVSMKFMAPAYSQTENKNSEFPAEFMQEVEKTQLPSVPPPNGEQQQPAATVPEPVPPPPSVPETQNQVPVGDGATATNPAMELTQSDEYVYDPTGKRDPFKIFKPSNGYRPAAKPIESLEPLQRWELERLQVVGILWDVRTPRAMIKDPNGSVYTVMKNSKVGRNEGFIAAIREGEVVVIETIYGEGQPTKETRVMELKK